MRELMRGMWSEDGQDIAEYACNAGGDFGSCSGDNFGWSALTPQRLLQRRQFSSIVAIQFTPIAGIGCGGVSHCGTGYYFPDYIPNVCRSKFF